MTWNTFYFKRELNQCFSSTWSKCLSLIKTLLIGLTKWKLVHIYVSLGVFQVLPVLKAGTYLCFFGSVSSFTCLIQVSPVKCITGQNEECLPHFNRPLTETSACGINPNRGRECIITEDCNRNITSWHTDKPGKYT